jgi:hypothetical protein
MERELLFAFYQEVDLAALPAGGSNEVQYKAMLTKRFIPVIFKEVSII